MTVSTRGAQTSLVFFLTQPEALLHPFLLPNMVRVAGKGSLSLTCACSLLNTKHQVSLQSRASRLDPELSFHTWSRFLWWRLMLKRFRKLFFSPFFLSCLFLLSLRTEPTLCFACLCVPPLPVQCGSLPSGAATSQHSWCLYALQTRTFSARWTSTTSTGL